MKNIYAQTIVNNYSSLQVVSFYIIKIHLLKNDILMIEPYKLNQKL